MGYLNHAIHEVMRYVDRMGPQEWLFAFMGIVVVGMVCGLAQGKYGGGSGI